MRVLGFILILLGGLAVVLAVNAWRLRPAAGFPAVGFLPLDEAAAAERLAGAVRIPTVSSAEREHNDPSQVLALHEYLRTQFPRVHAAFKREVVNGQSLLYTWTGTNPAAKPLLLLSHLDVVPVEPGTEGKWTHAPFSGDIADGFVWGRGTLDDKAGVLGQLEAAELLLGRNFAPARTIYFAFGHDEEIGGRQGAVQIAKLLQERGVHAEFTLDEGGAITLGVVAGVGRPVASVMAAEKGYVSFRLRVHAPGGHSSIPPRYTAVGQLARAVARLQDAPMPAHLEPPVSDMLDRLAPEMQAGPRLAVANRWLFGPLLRRMFERAPVTNALVRTTTAPTMFHAGFKDNVLPSEAEAVVNFRLFPGDTVADVEQHIRKVIRDQGVQVVADSDFASEATPVADTNSPAFHVLERTVGEVFPETVFTTGLFIAAADNRHYAAVRDNGYYFLPVSFRPQDLERVHGANERIGVHDYSRAVQFYARLMMNAAR
ncbi:MAG TPA: M20 family peptidase [Solimonas sp.]|nr:M20 family peptidase [Solimonas sp.]